MNLDLHGCVGVSAANKLCDQGLVSSVTFVKSHSRAGSFVFEAIEMELGAILQIGRISMAEATKHPFIAEAFARMRIDQFAGDDYVVFDHDHLSRYDPEMLEVALARSARSWRTPGGPVHLGFSWMNGRASR